MYKRMTHCCEMFSKIDLHLCKLEYDCVLCFGFSQLFSFFPLQHLPWPLGWTGQSAHTQRELSRIFSQRGILSLSSRIWLSYRHKFQRLLRKARCVVLGIFRDTKLTLSKPYERRPRPSGLSSEARAAEINCRPSWEKKGLNHSGFQQKKCNKRIHQHH